LGFFLTVLGFEFKASHTCQVGTLQPEPLCQTFYVLGIFKIGSLKLFAWAGVEPPQILLISASQVARITGVSQWSQAGFQFGMVKKFWKWRVVMGVQHLNILYATKLCI
jgi:hypothetical protein